MAGTQPGPHPCNSLPAAGSATVLRLWHALAKLLTRAYRPERYYMRGPGPKWREKYGRGLVAGQSDLNREARRIVPR